MGVLCHEKKENVSDKRMLVFEFLNDMYENVAETLPDPCNSTKRPRHGDLKRDPRGMTTANLKHLPPGKISHYLEILRSHHPSMKISAKLFNTVWQEQFLDKLRIRSGTHHSKCSLCVRHKWILRKVGPGPARAGQLLEYRRHLSRQRDDRKAYWFARSRSRTQSAGPHSEVRDVTMIVDSMDQAKRSLSMQSKEFGSCTTKDGQHDSHLPWMVSPGGAQPT